MSFVKTTQKLYIECAISTSTTATASGRIPIHCPYGNQVSLTRIFIATVCSGSRLIAGGMPEQAIFRQGFAILTWVGLFLLTFLCNAR
jgi:hypothetical protein